MVNVPSAYYAGAVPVSPLMDLISRGNQTGVEPVTARTSQNANSTLGIPVSDHRGGSVDHIDATTGIRARWSWFLS